MICTRKDEYKSAKRSQKPIIAQELTAWRAQVPPGGFLKQDESEISSTNSLPNGVYETPNGTWQVRVWYQGRQPCIGTFQTLEQATLANEIARGMLNKDKGLQLSAEECERNFKLAKEVTLADVPDTSKPSARRSAKDVPNGRPRFTSRPPRWNDHEVSALVKVYVFILVDV